MTKYGTKLTAVGIAKLANAQVTSSKVQITHIAIGDGNGVAYTPTGNETALKRETWRGTVNKAELGTGNTIIVEGIVPASVGGFTMREVGLYDVDGAMIAVGNYPETERAGTVGGVANELILRTLIKVNNASAVDLTINTDLTIATKAEMNVVTQQLAQITQNSDSTIRVGASGDTNSINTAIDYLSKKIVKYKQNGLKAEVKLLAGYAMNEQVIVDGLDLGWIEITSEDAVVTINRSALTQNSVGLPSYDGVTLPITSYAAFTGKNNAVLPQIKCLFSMDTGGTAASRDGICLVNGSQAVIHKDCGFINAGGKGAYVVHSSVLVANGAKLTNAGGGGISCFRNSRVAFRGGDVSNATGHGLYLDSASSMDAQGVIIENVGDNGIYLDGGSVIACPNSTITNATTNAIYCINGSIVDAHNSTISGSGARGVSCTSATVSVKGSTINTSTTDGIYCSGGVVTVDDGKINNSSRYAIHAVYGGNVSASRLEINGALEIAVNVDTASTVAITNGKIDNASKSAIVVANTSKVAANNIVINNAGSRGIQCEGASSVSIRNAQILNSISDGVYCAYSATVNADGATVTGSSGKSLYSVYGGLINARNANAQKVIGTNNNDDIRIEYGGIIVAHGATGGTVSSPNTIGIGGIVWRNIS